MECLPRELLTSIACHIVSPEDLVSFLRCCKALHDLKEDLLVHICVLLHRHDWRSVVLLCSANSNAVGQLSQLTLAHPHLWTCSQSLTNFNAASLLQTACYFGCTPLVQQQIAALKARSRPWTLAIPTTAVEDNYKGSHGLLALACISKKGELVQLLLQEGVDVNPPFPTLACALLIACTNGTDNVVQLLLSTPGIDVNVRGDTYGPEAAGITPLIAAAAAGHTSVVRQLLAAPSMQLNAHGGTIFKPNLFYNATALQWACHNGHADVAELLLSTPGVELHPPDSTPLHPLHLASQAGLASVVSCLLQDHHVHPDIPNGWAMALHLASAQGHSLVMQLLLQHGADVEATDSYWNRPLHRACTACQAEAVHVLLLYGADPNAPDDLGKRPLHLASEQGSTEVVQLLLEFGADIEGQYGHDGTMPLHVACAAGYLQLVQFLLDHGARVDAEAGYGGTPLQDACEAGQLGVVQRLIEQGAAISPHLLTVACRAGHAEVVRLLLRHGADPNHSEGMEKEEEDHMVSTPLHQACAAGHAPVVAVLLEAGARANVRDEEGQDPLILAAEMGAVQVVQLLLEHGADVDVTDGDGHTPLHEAAHKGNTEMVAVLLRHGASVDGSTTGRATPLECASTSGQHEAAQLLLQHGADVHGAPDSNTMPIHEASRHGHTRVVQLLLQHGAAVNAPGKVSSSTPVELAAMHSHADVLLLLLQHGATLGNHHHTHGTLTLWACNCRHWELAAALLAEGADDDRLCEKLSDAVSGDDVDLLRTLLLSPSCLDHLAQVGPHDKAWHLLHAACQAGHLEVTRLLLGLPTIDINRRDSANFTPLHQAAKHGHVAVAQLLLQTPGVNVHATAGRWTALHLACLEGWSEVVRLLLPVPGIDLIAAAPPASGPGDEAGNFPYYLVTRLVSHLGFSSRTDINSMSALHVACLSGHEEVVGLLLDHPGTDVNLALEREKATPLHIACKMGHVGVIRQLLAHPGIDPMAVDMRGATPLHAACSAKPSLPSPPCSLIWAGFFGHLRAEVWQPATVEQMLLLLLACPGVQVQAKNASGLTPLAHAVRVGNCAAVKCLLEVRTATEAAAAAVTTQPAPATTTVAPTSDASELPAAAVAAATTNAAAEASKAAAAAAAEAAAEDIPAVHEACRQFDVAILRMLVEAGVAGPEARSDEGGTPLLTACSAGQAGIVRELLDGYGADVSARDSLGRTAFHLACSSGSPAVVQLLLPRLDLQGLNAVDGQGKSALELACEHDMSVPEYYNGERDRARYPEVVMILLSSLSHMEVTPAAGIAVASCWQRSLDRLQGRRY